MFIKKIKGPIDDNALNNINRNFGLSDVLKTQINDLVLDSGESNSEVAQARGGHQVLSDRLNETDQQLAEKATKDSLGKTQNDLDETKKTIEDIIVTPTEGITEQEIIEARKGKGSLGGKIGEIDSLISQQIESNYRHLYRFGNEFSEITGGWERNVIGIDNESKGSWTISKETDHIELESIATSGPTFGSISPTGKIDLTDIDSIMVDWEVDSGSRNGVGVRSEFGIYSSKTTAIGIDNETTFRGDFGRRTTKLDTRDLEGEHYVRVFLGVSSSTTATLQMRMYGMYVNTNINQVGIQDIKDSTKRQVFEDRDMLYFKGDEYEQLTGGWVKGAENGEVEFTIDKRTKSMLYKFESNSVAFSSLVTNEPIDLTNINSLYIEWETLSQDTSIRYDLQITKVKDAISTHAKDDEKITLRDDFRRRIDSLDTRLFKGRYYISIHIGTGTNFPRNAGLIIHGVAFSGSYSDDNYEDESIISRNSDMEYKVRALSGQNRNLNKDTNFTIIHSTDTHGDKERVKSVVDYLNYNDSIDACLVTGDIVTGNAKSDHSFIPVALSSAEKPVLLGMGNHDAGQSVIPENVNTNEQMYTRILEPVLDKMKVSAEEINGKTYYYKDFNDYKFRVIMLNNFDAPNHTVDGEYVYHRGMSMFQQEQIDLFVDALQETPIDYHVIIGVHSAVGQLEKIDTPFTFTKTGEMSVFGTHGYSSYVDGEIIPTVVDAWVNGTSVTQSFAYTKTHEDIEEITVNVDFDSRGKGNFIAYLSGHYHLDVIARLKNFPNQYAIHTSCTSSNISQNMYSDMERSNGTKSEDCFSVVSFDTENRVINLARIGASVTRYGRERTIYGLEY